MAVKYKVEGIEAHIKTSVHAITKKVSMKAYAYICLAKAEDGTGPQNVIHHYEGDEVPGIVARYPVGSEHYLFEQVREPEPEEEPEGEDAEVEADTLKRESMAPLKVRCDEIAREAKELRRHITAAYGPHAAARAESLANIAREQESLAWRIGDR